jgi:hypothetical protein
LTVARVGQKQKKIDIEIPKLDDFIHKLYINVARKVYKNVYLFQQGIPPLQIQKNNRELEIIVQECIINTIRESIPVEKILQAYLGDEETIEEKTEEIIKEHIQPKPDVAPAVISSSNQNEPIAPDSYEPVKPLPSISFEDIDYVKDTNNNIMPVEAPKTDQRLKDLSDIRNQQRLNELNDEYEKLSISDQNISLSPLDIHVIDEPGIKLDTDFMLEDVELLD